MGIIVIDPGHGGNRNLGHSNANNATGPNGTKEKDLTLSIGIRTGEILNQLGHEVHLTRNSDVNVGLAARAAEGLLYIANVFVSIHFNASNNNQIQGTETWVHPDASNPSKLLANCVQQRMVLRTGYNDRGIRSNSWTVLNPQTHFSGTAACLTEISFLTNADDERRLQSMTYKRQLAQSLSDAIVDFLNGTSSLPNDPVQAKKFSVFKETLVRSLGSNCYIPCD